MLGPFKNLFGPVVDNIAFLPLPVEPLKKPIWTYGVSIKSCWDLHAESTEPTRNFRVFSPLCVGPLKKLIWTSGFFIKSCWDLYPKSTKPKKNLEYSYPSVLGPFRNLFGPVGDNITFLPLLFEPLKKPIWTFGFSIKFCGDLYPKSTKPKKKNRVCQPLHQPPLAKAILTNLDFFPSCSNSSPESIFAYLDFWVLYKILLGLVPKVNRAKKKNRASQPLQQPTLAKAILANLDFIPSCSDFSPESIFAYLGFWVLYKNWLGLVHRVNKTKKKKVYSSPFH